ncbi:MAG: hypothetical protein AAF518_20415 [Spirochaetota bacterium]
MKIKQKEIPFWQYESSTGNWKPIFSVVTQDGLPEELSLSIYNILFQLPKKNVKVETLQRIQNFPASMQELPSLTRLLIEKVEQSQEQCLSELQTASKKDALESFAQVFLYELKNNTFTKQPKLSEAIGKLWNQCVQGGLWTIQEAVALFQEYQIGIYCQAYCIDHQERFRKQMQLFQEVSSGIFILCEVGGAHVREMMQNPFIQDNYLLSHCIFSEEEKENFWGRNVVLYRKGLPLQKAYELNLEDRAFYVQVRIAEKLDVFAVHTSAYDLQTERRKKQLQQTLSFSSYPIVGGDLNIHNAMDEKNLLELGLCDCSDTLENPITFDGDGNSLTQYIYLHCERRQMKLDRILYAEQIPYRLQAVERIATQEYSYGGITAHLSDHFGLQACFVKK